MRDVREFLAEVLRQYAAETYKERFDWIDHITDVRSKRAIAALDAELTRRLQARELDHIWLAPPDLINWADSKGFKFLRRRTEPVEDLDTTGLILAAGDNVVDLEWLKRSVILWISASRDDVADQWPAYKCIYAEIEINNTMHVLNAGKWFQVARDFTRIINSDFVSIP